jgi:hypothetical protein
MPTFCIESGCGKRATYNLKGETMSTIDDSVGKLARVYDSATDTWVPLIGAPAPHEHTTASSMTVAGNASISGSASITGNASVTGDLTVTGLFSVNEIIESIPTLSIVSGSVSVNFATANNYYVSSFLHQISFLDLFLIEDIP